MKKFNDTKCNFCGKSFSTKYYLTIHLKKNICKVNGSGTLEKNSESLVFKCSKCLKSFSNKSNLNKHARSTKCSKTEKKNSEETGEVQRKEQEEKEKRERELYGEHSRSLPIPSTSTGRTRSTTLTTALAAAELEPSLQGKANLFKCDCGEEISIHDRTHLDSIEHVEKFIAKNCSNTTLRVLPFKRHTLEYFFACEESEDIGVDILKFFECVKPKVVMTMRQEIRTRRCRKILFYVKLEYSKPNYQRENDNEVDEDFQGPNITIHHSSCFEVISSSTNLGKFYERQKNNILSYMDGFETTGSGWRFEKILLLGMKSLNYSPNRGGSFIPTPQELKKRNSLLNIRNSDEFCFLYCIIAKLFPQRQNRERVIHYIQHLKRISYDGLSFPLKLEDVHLFVKQNRDISINVFIYERAKQLITLALPIGKYKRQDIHVNLLLIESEDQLQFHYILITDFNSLISPQLLKGNNKRYVCDSCFVYFRKEEQLSLHYKYNRCLLRPHIFKKNEIKFESVRHQIPQRFSVYCDFECIITKKSEIRGNIEITSEMHPSSFCMYIHCPEIENDSKLNRPIAYNGEDSALRFVMELQAMTYYLYVNYLTKKKEIQMTCEDKLNFESSTHCKLCKKAFSSTVVKCRDHDKLTSDQTSNYRFALCRLCNVLFSESNLIIVCFHNLRFDCRLFLSKIYKIKSKADYVTLIARNKENWISFSWFICVQPARGGKKTVFIELRFIDTLNFLLASLDTVVGAMESGELHVTRKFFKGKGDVSLLLRKLKFPYSYFDSFERYDDRVFPSKESFFDDLTQKDVSQEDYDHSLLVFNTFCKGKTLKAFNELYNILDVLLLTDCMQSFRKYSHETFGLEALKYYSNASLSFNCMLKYTGVTIQLVTDPEQYELIKKSVRGGLCQSITRYAKSNHEDCHDYDPSKPLKEVVYTDLVSLYPSQMISCLPVSDYEFVDESDFEKVYNEMLNLSDDSDHGYLFECDLMYPDNKKTHDIFRYFCFIGEMKKPPNSRFDKLITDLLPKFYYPIFYQLLKRCIHLGMKVTKIHRILKFTQSSFMSRFIELNMERRKHSLNKYHSFVAKSMLNSTFGFFLKNEGRYREFKLISEWGFESGKRVNIAQNLISSIRFKDIFEIDENVCCVEMETRQISVKSPILVGSAILDKSKCHLVDTYYFLINKIENLNLHRATTDEIKLYLCYVDTDSLLFTIHNIRFHDFIRPFVHELFDTSDYDEYYLKLHRLPVVNKKRLGFLKVETFGLPILEFVTLGPKVYCLHIQRENGNKSVPTMKGLKKSIVEKFTIENYKKVLFGENSDRISYHHQYRISLKNFKIHTVRERKKGLVFFDDKRITLENNIDTIPYGHYLEIENEEEEIEID